MSYMLENFITLTGKTVKFERIFESSGEDFVAFRRAETYLTDKGYKVGSMCRNEPIAAVIAFDYVAKWKNIQPNEYKKIDALILSDDFRNGNVRVVEFEVKASY